MIIPKHYEHLRIHQAGTTANRSYFIPTSVKTDHLVELRENSERFQLQRVPLLPE